MKRKDIEVNKKYQCKKFLADTVTCRIVSKHLGGFLMREQHGVIDDFWHNPPVRYLSYGWITPWRVIEKW